MLSRRRFIEMTAASTVAGAALAVSQDALAASATGTVWASSTWQAVSGQRITIVDSSGASHAVRVGLISVLPAQTQTTGEAFIVVLRSTSSQQIPDGLYRLRGGVRGQVFLAAATSGTATLTVSTVRPAA